MDFANLSFTQARKAEVDSQVRVLELEAQLVAERERLAEMRRHNYSTSAEVEQVIKKQPFSVPKCML